MLEDIRRGDVCIFKNGEEAIVERIDDKDSYFRIYFNKEVAGWIKEKTKNRYWDYKKEGTFITVEQNGNDIVKVIKC